MQAILKQSSWLLGAQMIARTIGFFYTIFLAKTLGVSDFGLYSIALTYFSLFSIITDFGFTRYLVREVSLNPKKSSLLLFHVSILRLLISALLFVSFAFLLNIVDPDKPRVALVLLAGLAIIPQAIALTFDAIFTALQKLQYSSISLVFLSLAGTLFGFYFLRQGFGAPGALYGFIAGHFIYLLILAFFLKIEKINYFDTFSIKEIKNLIIGSLPYAFLGILGLLYFKIDTLILAYLKGNFDTGIYSAAYRFLEVIVFMPGALAAALFPVLTRSINNNFKSTYELYLKFTGIVLSVALIVSVSYFYLLPFLIAFFLPQYMLSISVVKILSLTVPFLFMISIQGVVLMSRKQFLKSLIIMSIFNLCFNIVLNFFLISQYSYTGAAWATVISDIVGFSLFFVYIRIKLYARS